MAKTSRASKAATKTTAPGRTTSNSKKSDRKENLLNAAATIVAREGAAHLTIDRVAAEAGLSKGGVLYHYPSKRALLEGMLSRLMQEMENRATRYRNTRGSSELGAWIKSEHQQTAQERATSLALLANVAEDPTLLDPARAMIRRIFTDVADESSDPDFAQILILAVEGMRFLNMLDLLPFKPADQNRIHARLFKLAGEACA
jgi:AcrR family transcriptional regulator